MESSIKLQDPSFLPSPKNCYSPNTSSTTTSSSSSNNNNNNNNTPPPSQPPQQLKPLTRSECANPYPTTFVQADSSSFKQVVQMLTGSSETVKHAAAAPQPDPNPKIHIPPIKSIPRSKQQSGFKLYERRSSLKNLKINPLKPLFAPNTAAVFSPRKHEILSPSILDFPALVLSPVTPLIPDPFDRSGAPIPPTVNHDGGRFNPAAEERAIKEKGFYLHPSPTTTPRDSEPRLLPLFPVTSPRVSGSSAT